MNMNGKTLMVWDINLMPTASLPLTIYLFTGLQGVKNIDEGYILWAVDINPEQDITTLVPFKNWEIYQVPVLEKERYTLYLTEEPDIDTYDQLNRIISLGSSLLVATPWKPLLPYHLDDCRWCFSTVNHPYGSMVCDQFMPERVTSRAKSARK